MTKEQTDVLDRIHKMVSVEHRTLFAHYLKTYAISNREDSLERLRRGEYTEAKINIRVCDELVDLADKLTM